MGERKDLAEAIGQTIKEARKRAGLSQQALATRIGVSASTVSRWERRHRSIGVHRVEEVADALTVDYHDLLDRVVAILAARSKPPDEDAPASSA